MNAHIDVTDVRIETERLILRPWQESDLEDLYTYASVEGVGERAGWSCHKSREESLFILNSFIEHKKTLALELKENGCVIGSSTVITESVAPCTTVTTKMQELQFKPRKCSGNCENCDKPDPFWEEQK